MVAAAGVYDCESVTSSARDKTHEGMLPVIRPDRSKWGVSPVFRRLHANGGIDMTSVSDSQCLYSNNSAVVRTARRRARRFEVEDLGSFGVALRSLIGGTKNGTVAYEPGTQASAGIFLPPR